MRKRPQPRVIALALGLGAPVMACGGSVTPQALCDGFVGMLEREGPSNGVNFTDQALRLKLKQCLADSERWVRVDADEFQRTARCAIRQRDAIGWARCGVGNGPK